jgi:hypothetical protein
MNKMSKKANKSTMSFQDKTKDVEEKVNYILQKYNCRLQIRMEPKNWFSRKFSKYIKIGAGIIILDNQTNPNQLIPPLVPQDAKS